jgi:FtsH-binding integral membrane protein
VNLLLATSSWVRFVLWLPAIVVAAGLVAATFILLGRAFVATVRESGHPRWVWAGLAGLVGAVIVLTWLGISLPRE